jgi:hypothetical protein
MLPARDAGSSISPTDVAAATTDPHQELLVIVPPATGRGFSASLMAWRSQLG